MSTTSGAIRKIFCSCLLFSVFLILISFCRILNGRVYYRIKSPLQSSADDSYTVLDTNDAVPRSIESIMEQIQLGRRNLIEERCNKMLWRRQSSRARFYIENRHQLMYCYIPKVASTNLKRLLLVLSGTFQTEDLSSIPRNMVHEENQMKKFETFNNAEIIKNRLANYTKLIVVRHPFERLVSAYIDKFVKRNSTFYQQGIGRDIIRKYRTHPSELSLQSGNDVTFTEFVNYVIGEWTAGRRQLDVHWRPMIDLCLPCSIDYDIIGKFETLNEDVDFLSKKLKEKRILQLFKTQNQSAFAFNVTKELMDKLNPKQMTDLYQIYSDDFEIFSYK